MSPPTPTLISEAEAQQDALRPLRNFVTLLSGVVTDQSWAKQDGYAYNPAYQYQTVGSTGNAIEGSTAYQTKAVQGAQVTITPMMLIFVVGAVLVLK